MESDGIALQVYDDPEDEYVACVSWVISGQPLTSIWYIEFEYACELYYAFVSELKKSNLEMMHTFSIVEKSLASLGVKWDYTLLDNGTVYRSAYNRDRK